MMEALDIGVDVQEFPHLCQQIDYVLERREERRSDGEKTQDDREEREDAMPDLEEAEVDKEDTDDGHVRKFPKSPNMRSGYMRGGISGWEVIDRLSVTQCAKMTRGMPTVDFIPNTL